MQKHRNSSMVKSAVIGMAIGGATAALGTAIIGPSNKRSAKKSMNKAIKSVGDIVDSIQHVIH